MAASAPDCAGLRTGSASSGASFGRSGVADPLLTRAQSQPSRESSQAMAPELNRAASVSRLLRTSSATFGGGASFTARSAVEEPLLTRTQSQRVRDTSQAQRAMHEHLQTFAFRSRGSILCCCGCGSCIAVLVYAGWLLSVFFKALGATIYHRDEPCDQPLSWFMPVCVLWGISSLKVSKLLQRLLFNPLETLAPRAILVRALVPMIPGYLMLAWGLYMAWASHTCEATNPDLYYPVRTYIFTVAILDVLSLIFLVATSCGLWFLVRIVNELKLVGGQGCERAVRALPKIPQGAEELIDPEDGSMRDCPICTDSLSDAASKAVVRTTCGHYYHEDCLATWCQGNLTCPVCRQQVGEPDGSPEAQQVGEP